MRIRKQEKLFSSQIFELPFKKSPQSTKGGKLSILLLLLLLQILLLLLQLLALEDLPCTILRTLCVIQTSKKLKSQALLFFPFCRWDLKLREVKQLAHSCAAVHWQKVKVWTGQLFPRAHALHSHIAVTKGKIKYSDWSKSRLGYSSPYVCCLHFDTVFSCKERQGRKREWINVISPPNKMTSEKFL